MPIIIYERPEPYLTNLSLINRVVINMTEVAEKKPFSYSRRTLMVGLVGLVAIGVILVVVLTRSSNNSTGNNTTAAQLKTITVPAPKMAFESTSDNFMVNFPDNPTTLTSTFDSPTAGRIPVTEYREQYTSGLEYAYYTIFVYHYPAGYSFASDYLNGALDTFRSVVNSTFPGTTIASEHSTTLFNAPALSGDLTVPVRLTLSSTTKTDTGDNLLVTTNKQNAYIINCYGMPVADYNLFLNSFKFLT